MSFDVETLCPICKTNKIKLSLSEAPCFTHKESLWFQLAKDSEGHDAPIAYSGDKQLLILCQDDGGEWLSHINTNEFATILPPEVRLSQ